MAGFEPVIHLLLKGSASGILVQTLYERWWDTTYTFHIAEREITVTSYDFHWMMGFSDDADEAKPSHRLLSSLISLPSTHTHRLSLLHHKILFPCSLSPLTTPIPIHFSSPYPYPFRFCLVSYLFDFLFWLLWNFGFGFGYLTLGYLFKIGRASCRERVLMPV